MTDHYVAYMESEIRALRAERDHLKRLLDQALADLQRDHHCDTCQAATDTLQGGTK